MGGAGVALGSRLPTGSKFLKLLCLDIELIWSCVATACDNLDNLRDFYSQSGGANSFLSVKVVASTGVK